MNNVEEFKPKDGDIIVLHSIVSPVVLIFKKMSDDGKSCYYYAACSLRADSPFESRVQYKGRERYIDARPATSEERGFIQRRLEMDGIGYNRYYKLFKMDDKPQNGQTYYYVDSFLCISSAVWGEGGSEETYRYNAGNCFLDPKEADYMKHHIQGFILEMRKEKNQNDKRNNLI